MSHRRPESPRDYVEWFSQPSGVVRLGGDGVSFEASASFDVEMDIATIKGGIAFGKGTPRATRGLLRRFAQVLKQHGLRVRWVHKGREHIL